MEKVPSKVVWSEDMTASCLEEGARRIRIFPNLTTSDVQLFSVDAPVVIGGKEFQIQLICQSYSPPTLTLWEVTKGKPSHQMAERKIPLGMSTLFFLPAELNAPEEMPADRIVPALVMLVGCGGKGKGEIPELIMVTYRVMSTGEVAGAMTSCVQSMFA